MGNVNYLRYINLPLIPKEKIIAAALFILFILFINLKACTYCPIGRVCPHEGTGMIPGIWILKSPVSIID